MRRVLVKDKFELTKKDLQTDEFILRNVLVLDGKYYDISNLLCKLEGYHKKFMERIDLDLDFYVIARQGYWRYKFVDLDTFVKIHRRYFGSLFVEERTEYDDVLDYIKGLRRLGYLSDEEYAILLSEYDCKVIIGMSALSVKEKVYFRMLQLKKSL